MVNFYVFGVLGLLFIILGTFMLSIKKRVNKKKIYSFLLPGGILLLIYSIYIQDMIFIVLQSVYILVVIYDITKLKQGIA